MKKRMCRKLFSISIAIVMIFELFPGMAKAADTSVYDVTTTVTDDYALEQDSGSTHEHVYENVIVPASPADDGYLIERCTVCGEVKSETEIPRPDYISLDEYSFPYDGIKKKPSVTVFDAENDEISESHYSVEYVDNVNAGEGTVVITFDGTTYSGQMTETFSIEKETQTVTATKQYVKKINSKAFYLDAKTDQDGALVYQSNNTAVASVSSDGKVTVKGPGTAKIKVYAKQTENYNKSATVTVTIKVKLNDISLKKVSAKSIAHLTATWKKNAKVDGYQIQMAYDKDFQIAMKKNIKNKNTTKYTFSDVLGGQKVYVRIRSYIKNSGKTWYSKWSSVKKITSKLAGKSRLVPINKLKNLNSLRQGCSMTELQKAYNKAQKNVRILVGLSKKKQLQYLAQWLRDLFDYGYVKYSMTAPHYADPYGYFVIGVGSCAGCARATGMCLNMLGYSYQHVNENQYTHQWCRVKVGKEYWICDAYGLYVGKEPKPYKHPNF